MQAPTLKRTPLYDRHASAGAKLVDFAGWEMPVQYAGVREEHEAVRGSCGIFDVSHMGQIETSGAQAEALLQRLTTNDVAAIPIGGAQYGLLLEEDGGVIDDLFTYRLAADTYLTVTNASNHETDLAWFQRHADGFDAQVSDAHALFAMIAVQGPTAREKVQAIADRPLPRRMQAEQRVLAGLGALVCGTGYTGEDGVELLCAPDVAGPLWDALANRGAKPAGLAARDTLRLEACFHLYGNDLSRERNPIEAGLGWACKEQTGFIGAEAVAAARRDGTKETLVPFRISGPGIARQGHAVVGGGVVTSGTMSPSIGIGVGLAYVPADQAEVGTPFQIDVRGKLRDATVDRKPLYRPHDEESDG